MTVLLKPVWLRTFFFLTNCVSPSQALLGVPPRDLYETDNSTLDSYIGSVSSSADAMECALRLRLLAKDSIIQSIIEDRIARANNTRSQRIDTNDLQIGQKTIDIYRAPDSRTLGKGGTGWHGPADLLEFSHDNSKAVVVWQGMPLLLPTRHIREHICYLQTLLTHYTHTPHLTHQSSSNTTNCLTSQINGHCRWTSHRSSCHSRQYLLSSNFLGTHHNS